MATAPAYETQLGPTITYRSDALTTAMIGPICAAVWRKKPDRASFAVQREQLAAAVRQRPGRVGFLCLIEPGTEPPEQAEREGSAAMITSHEGRLSVVACVVEGDGFRAAITRTVLSGMILVVRRAPPVRVFGNASLASPWLASHLDGENLSALARRLDEIRSQ